MFGRILAQVFSYVFHPLLMPAYGMLILLFSDSYIAYTMNLKGKLLLASMVLSLTFIFPSILIVLMKRLKLISSIELGNREERTLPFIVVVIFFYLTYQLFLNYNLPSVFYLFLLSGIVIVTISLLINFLWKISAHMMGVGSMVGAMIGLHAGLQIDLFWTIISGILISGLVGFARLRLKAHSPAQVYGGFCLGATLVWAMFWFLIR